MSDEDYRNAVLDHYEDPRNIEKLDDPDLRGVFVNESCGDRVELTINTEKGKIEDTGVEVDGCVISKAFSSMFSVAIKGEKVEYISEIDEEEFFDFLNCFPRRARKKCALTVFEALKDAI